jgi:hypothetical protein
MPIIFSTVRQFEEQINRRREHKSQANELDTIETVFTGQSIGADGFLPHDLATHPQYPFMLCCGWNVVDKEALMCEIHVSYVGKMDLSGRMVSTSSHEGSISWTTYKQMVSKILTPRITVTQQDFGPGFTGGTFTGPGVVAATYSTSYLSVSYVCQYKVSSTKTQYLSRTPIVGGGFGADITVPIQKTYVTGASLSDNRLGLVTAALKFQNELSIENSDLGNGWFLVTETLVPTPYIDSTAILSTS